MNQSLALALLAGALGLAGCATDPQTAAAPAGSRKVEPPETAYVTGSRIPRKDAGDQMVSKTSQREYRTYSGDGLTAGPKGN